MNRLFNIILLIAAGTGLFAQDISISVEAPKVVAVGEQFMVTWVVNSRGGDFQPPQFDDFYKLMGPQTSFSSSTQIINGKVSSEVKNSFSYYLQATREGKFTIGQATYTEKREKIVSDPVEIEVVREKQQAGNTQPAASGSEGDQPAAVAGSDMYLRILVNRTRVYRGEHIVATLKLYSKNSLSGIQDYRFPDFNSFLKEDIETPQPRNLERENVNGEIYGTAVLQRFLLYPQRSGKIEIDPASLTVLVQEKVRSNDPFFGDFFSSFNTIPRMLASLPVQIEVMDLPPGEPSSFSGTVGSVTIKSETDKDTLGVNDALTYRIILSGNGNIKLASAPQINISPDIEIYEPKTISDLKSTISGTSGTKTFEYILIPRYHGSYIIPSFQFSYFDPDLKRYRTVETGEKKFFVTKSEGDEQANEVFGAVSREDVRYLGKDIRYIKTSETTFRNDGKIMISGSVIYLLFASVLTLFGLILIIRKEQVRRNSDLARVRNRKAGRMATRRLKQASVYLKANDPHRFYSELLKAIWGYIGDKLDIPVSRLNREMALKVLSERGINDELIKLTGDLIDRCEYSRYAPEGEDNSQSEVYNIAVRVIREIENNI